MRVSLCCEGSYRRSVVTASVAVDHFEQRAPLRERQRYDSITYCAVSGSAWAEASIARSCSIPELKYFGGGALFLPKRRGRLKKFGVYSRCRHRIAPDSPGGYSSFEHRAGRAFRHVYGSLQFRRTTRLPCPIKRRDLHGSMLEDGQLEVYLDTKVGWVRAAVDWAAEHLRPMVMMYLMLRVRLRENGSSALNQAFV